MLEPGFNGLENYFLVFNVQLVVAQNRFELLARQLFEFRALLQYPLEVMANVFPALLFQVAAEIVAGKVEDACRVAVGIFQ